MAAGGPFAPTLVQASADRVQQALVVQPIAEAIVTARELDCGGLGAAALKIVTHQGGRAVIGHGGRGRI